MTDILDLLASAAFWTATLRIATPYILGTLGNWSASGPGC